MDWQQAIALVDIARWRLMQKFPWARRTLRALRFVESHHGTLSIDPWLRVYVDPAAVERWQDNLQGILWHECSHVLRRHFDRMCNETGCPDKSKANVAGDIEINGEILDGGILTLPDGLLTPSTITQIAKLKVSPPAPFMPAEWWYDNISNLDESGGSGDVPDCGSAAGGTPGPDELGPPSPDEKSKIDRIMSGQDQDIVDKGHGGGFTEGLSEALYEEALERLYGGHDWRSTLGNEIRSCVDQAMDDAEEYTFRRPSRRQASIPQAILPASFRPIPNLTVVVDVSSSMDEAKLKASMRELHAILNRLAIPTYTAVAWNGGFVRTVYVNGDNDIPKVYATTGGGTNMVTGVEYAIKQGAEIVVILTDCDCGWQNLPSTVPMVIGGINRSQDPRNFAPWVKLVDVETV